MAHKQTERLANDDGAAKEDIEQKAIDHLKATEPLRYSGNYALDIYYKTKDEADLDTAIQWYQKYFNMTLMDEDRAGLLEGLGSAFNRKYHETKDQSYHDSAILLWAEMVKQTEPKHRKYAARHHHVAAAYRDRFCRTRNAVDLDTSISWYQKSLDLEKLGGAYALRTYNLAIGYHDKFRQTNNAADLEKVIELLQDGVDHSSSNIEYRLSCAEELIPIYARTNSWKEAYHVAKITIDLAPSLTRRGLENDQILDLSAQFAGLASVAAAMALYAIDDPFEAVQILESGRGILSRYLSEMRGAPPTTLDNYPELKKRYFDCRSQLDFPDSQPALANGDKIDRWPQRLKVSDEMETLRTEIQSLPGLENSMLPLRKEDIQAAAKFGHIVIVNATPYRCDAILIEQHGIRPLPLPKLKGKEIEEKTRQRDFSSPKTLEWMWDTIAGPVLEELGLTCPRSDGKWSRIWWIPIGLLTKFPLHAAGVHAKKSSRAVIDRAMSSYSPSINAILYGRSCRNLDLQLLAPDQALLVAVPRAPGASPLRFATKEVEQVRKLCESMNFNTIQPGQHKSDVVPHLPQCKIFHFAGHGFTNSIDPSKSCLLLEDGKKDPLTVVALLDMNLREQLPFLAYLSACGTGQIKDERYLDETIHLISAFQLAGFRHVIGTLWEVRDAVCVDVASIIYETIRVEGLTDESVCLGLHSASRKLRDEWVGRGGPTRDLDHRVEAEDASSDHQSDNQDEVSRHIGGDNKKRGSLNWVPYVHFGV